MNRKTLRFISYLTAIFGISSFQSIAQQDVCGAGTPSLTIGSSCTATAYNVSSGFGNEIAAASCFPTIVRDGWFTFTTSATMTSVSIYCSTNRDLGLAVYTGSCGSLTEVACSNNGGSGTQENIFMMVSPSTTYYLRVARLNTGSNNMTGSICITSPTVTTTCSGNFYDTGGSGGNYSNSQNYSVTYCPSSAGQCVTLNFTSFNVENGWDYLYLYDGNSTNAYQFGSSPYTGTSGPGSVTATSSNTSGCLTATFISDGSNTASGWAASVSCGSCSSTTGANSPDCGALTQVCNDASFSGNSSGAGNYTDLTGFNEGCLRGENQTSWYSFTATTSGSLSLSLTPSNGTDDYDFAIWGPLTTLSCPPVGSPIRCSWAAGSGSTGLASGNTDYSEGATGNGWVAPINATAGDSYVMVIDNYSASTSPFTLDWTLGGGATLGCTPLPVELVQFSGFGIGQKNKLEWATASETNNAYFTLEHSSDGIVFSEVGSIAGAGTSSTLHNYSYIDEKPFSGLTYYRLIQTDQNGHQKYSNVISIENNGMDMVVNNLHPNPTNGSVGFDFYSGQISSITIEVLDYTGRLVKKETKLVQAGKNELISNLEDLPKGIYSFKVTDQNSGFSSVNKLVKN